jgi:hypothetical protein
MFLSPLPRMFVVPVKLPQVATQHEHLFNDRTANLKRLAGRLEAGEVFCLSASQKRVDRLSLHWSGISLSLNSARLFLERMVRFGQRKGLSFADLRSGPGILPGFRVGNNVLVVEIRITRAFTQVLRDCGSQSVTNSKKISLRCEEKSRVGLGCASISKLAEKQQLSVETDQTPGGTTALLGDEFT